MERPIIYVIAGPNGIGKTTSDFDFIPDTIPIINSDEIAAEAKRTGFITGNTQEYAYGEAVICNPERSLLTKADAKVFEDSGAAYG